MESVENIVEKLNNKKLGNKFEKDFMDLLAKKGYWVTFLEGKANIGSQPADLMACKNNIPYLIDCKTLSNKNGIFNLNRLEENQRLAYIKFRNCGNLNYYLAILWNNNIYIINLDNIDLNSKSIKLKEYKPEVLNFYDK